MTEQPIELTTDINSAKQSFHRSELDDSQVSGPSKSAVEWSTASRGKAAVIALLITTVALTIMFSPTIHRHPRLTTLQNLAKLWMLCNLILVVAVSQ